MHVEKVLGRLLTTNVLLAAISAVGVSIYVWVYLLITDPQPNFQPSKINYFRPEASSSRAAALSGQFIVNQKHCKIPEVKLWSVEATRNYALYKPPPCLKGVNGSIPGLTFVNRNKLVINEALLKSMNLTLDLIDCCYQEIQQPPPDIAEHLNRAFMRKSLSENCTVINGSVIVPEVNSLQVLCFKVNVSEIPTLIHRDFHILANVLPKDAKIQRKMKYWKKKTDLPPSVYILGLDCGNRLNIRRQMPSTVKFLQRLGASEMLGYTKVGPHTGCNLRPILTSFTEAEMERICNYTSDRFVDSCPWIFYNFSDANYVTSFFEDGSSLKHERDAFLIPPTDFYNVVWARYVHKRIGKDQFNVCMENKTIHEVMIDFNENLARNMGELGIPYFSLTWIGYLAHDNFNGYQHIDKYFRDSLQRLSSSGYLSNTVVILVGDHGYRWYDIRSSVPGWYEDKQPVLWLSLPPKVTQQWPQLKPALEYNSNKLSSPFDLHQTLQHVLSLTTGKPLKDSSRGMSLFKKLKDRNCSQAGIPIGYCVCTVLLPFNDIQRPFLYKAAAEALHVRNYSGDTLPKKNCKKLRLENVVGAAVTSDSYQDNLTDDQLEDLVISGRSYLVLGVITSVFNDRPQLEFIMKYDKNSQFQFETRYGFGVDATIANDLFELGFHRCLTFAELRMIYPQSDWDN